MTKQIVYLLAFWGIFGIQSARADDMRPATNPTTQLSLQEKVQPKIDAIQQEIERRRQTNPQAVDILANDLRHIRDLLANKISLKTTNGDARVHVVGLYGPKSWRSNEIVEVAVSDHPIILVLSSYDPVRWEIKLDQGAQIQRVILAGYNESRLSWSNPSQAVPVDSHFYDNGDRNYFYAYAKDTPEYQKLQAVVKQLTGDEITTFQGMPGGNGGPYIVGPNSPAWYAQIIEDQLDPLYREATAIHRATEPMGAQTQTFKAIYYLIDPIPAQVLPNGRQIPARPRDVFSMSGMLADFTTGGPIQTTFQSLPDRIAHVAFDPAAKVWYGIDDHSVFSIAPGNNGETRIKIKGDVPQMSWLNSLAFDTKRRRLIVGCMVGSDGVGQMCAYSPEKNEWSYIREIPRPGNLQSLVYVPEEDCFYALEQNSEGQHPKTLIRRLNGDCVDTNTIEMSEPIVSGEGPVRQAQLILIDQKLAILVSPHSSDVDHRTLLPGKCVLVDAKTGNVISSKTIMPHVAGTAEVDPKEVDHLWRMLGSASDADAASAVDRLAAGGDKAVAFLAKRFSSSPHPTTEQVNQSINQLSDQDEDVREKATCDLIQDGPEITKQLQDAAAQLPPEAQTRIQIILNDITSDARTHRMQRTIHILTEIATPKAVEQLIQLSPDDPDARTALRGI